MDTSYVAAMVAGGKYLHTLCATITALVMLFVCRTSTIQLHRKSSKTLFYSCKPGDEQFSSNKYRLCRYMVGLITLFHKSIDNSVFAMVIA